MRACVRVCERVRAGVRVGERVALEQERLWGVPQEEEGVGLLALLPPPCAHTHQESSRANTHPAPNLSSAHTSTHTRHTHKHANACTRQKHTPRHTDAPTTHAAKLSPRAAPRGGKPLHPQQPAAAVKGAAAKALSGGAAGAAAGGGGTVMQAPLAKAGRLRSVSVSAMPANAS